jgi:hypothetical protein
MRFQFGLTFVLCAVALCGQTASDPELARARADVEHLRTLVAAGAAPRAELQRAEEKIADAEDAAFLRRTLYGRDLTESQNEEMIAAAQRRLDRRKAAVARARALVDEGVASISSVTTYLEDLDRARKEFDLAESRARLCRELTVMAKAEEEYHSHTERSPLEAHSIAERYDGSGTFTGTDFHRVEAAFEGHFGKAMPVSAMGETAVHRALGFDHRGRVDVAIHPDQPEGVWLRRYLEDHRIPYFAFRQAVPGKATGAHIHIGPMSTRVARTGSGAVSGS